MTIAFLITLLILVVINAVVQGLGPERIVTKIKCVREWLRTKRTLLSGSLRTRSERQRPAWDAARYVKSYRHKGRHRLVVK